MGNSYTAWITTTNNMLDGDTVDIDIARNTVLEFDDDTTDLEFDQFVESMSTNININDDEAMGNINALIRDVLYEYGGSWAATSRRQIADSSST